MLSIVQAPNEVLSKKAQKVGRIDNAIRNLLLEMEQTLDFATDPEGVGLAAPQVGKSLQIFIVRQTPKSPLLTCINPELTIVTEDISLEKSSKNNASSRRKSPVKLEGCLSLNNIWGVVHRHPNVSLTYLDEKGIQHTKSFKGFMATIMQHEYDHLQGILFPKRVLEQKEKLYKSHKDKDGETVFDEISI